MSSQLYINLFVGESSVEAGISVSVIRETWFVKNMTVELCPSFHGSRYTIPSVNYPNRQPDQGGSYY